MAKKNDWVATMLFNQPSSMDEIIANGITPDNTGIQSKEYYKNIDAVQQTFTNDKGEFDEASFDNFYNSALNMYNQLAQEDWTSKLINEMDRDPFDWTKPLNTSIKDISATVTTGYNPERRSMSITGIGTIGDPTFSIREIAQDNEVQDEAGNKLGWTPNQKKIMSIFEPTIALATWDEDGTHVENGRTVMHKKGDYKINDNGDFYYETLGTREAYDKEILRVTDVLTTDGSTLNKFDFFDSDGLTKSAASVVGKTAMQIVPLLIPGVGPIYGTVSALTTFASVLPTLAKSINGILGGNDNGVGKTLTQMENWFGQFAPTTSDKGKQSFFSLENIGEILTSSAKQLYQQKSLANLAKLVNKNDALRASNWGQKISLGYLALTSSKDVYGDFKRAGASDAMAGIGMLASTAALYGLMDTDYFREQLFKGTFMDESEANDIIRNFNADEISKVNNLAKTPDIDKALTLYDRFRTNIQNKLEKFIKSPYSGKAPDLVSKGTNAWNGLKKTINRAVNEGVEETMEEVVFDLVKGVSSALNAMGVPVSEKGKDLDFGFTLEDTLLRYASSFVGGALGGAVFEGINLWEKTIGPKIVELSDLDSKQQMTYFIATGRADELRDRAKLLYDKGKLGNKNLSAHKTEKNSKGEIIYAQGNETDNQNKLAYDAIINHINYVETILNKHGINLMMDVFGDPESIHMNEDYAKELKKQKDAQKVEKTDDQEYTYRHKTNALLEVFNQHKFDSSYVNDVVELGQQIVDTQAKIDSLTAKKTDSKSKTEAKTKEIEFLNKQLDDLLKKRDNLISGVNTDKYVHEVLFTTSPSVRGSFMGNDATGDAEFDEIIKGSYWANSIEGYVKSRYHKDYHKLADYEKAWYKKEFDEYQSLVGQDQLRRAAKIHYDIIQTLDESLRGIEETLKDKGLDNYHSHGTLNSEDSTFNRYEILSDHIIEARLGLDVVKKQFDAYVQEWNPENGDIKTSEEYVQFENEILRLTEEIADLESELSDLTKIYGENADTQESITEAGRSNLYDKLIEALNNIDTDENILTRFQRFKQLEAEVTDLEFTAEGDPDMEEALVTKQAELAALSEILSRFDEDGVRGNVIENFKIILDLVRNYYNHLKDGNLVSQNHNVLKRALNLISAKVISQLDKIQDLEIEIDIENEEVLFDLLKVINNDIREYFRKLLVGEVSQAAAISETLISTVSEIFTKEGITEDPTQFINALIDKYSYGLGLPKFISDINAITEEITSFSIIDLIHKAQVNIGENVLNVIDLLETEERAFLNSTKLDPYLINDRVHLDALKQIPRILLLASSVFDSVYSGLNAALNEYRVPAGKDELLGDISESTKEIVASDIQYLTQKTLVLLDKHNEGLNRKTNFHQMSEVRIKTDFVRNLLFKKDEENSFLKRLQTAFYGDNDKTLEEAIDALLAKHNINPNAPISDFKKYNTFFIELGDLLYDEIHSKLIGDNVDIEIGKRLAQVLPSDAYKLMTGKITDNPDAKYKLTEWSTIVYLGTLLTERASDFWISLKKLEDANPKIVPIIGQEWNIQIGYANILHSDTFNTILDAVAKQTIDEDVEDVQKTYISARSKLKNFIFIQGGAGSGKTSVVAKYITELLKGKNGKTEVITLGPEETQAKLISDSLGTTKPYTFYEFLSKIYPQIDDVLGFKVDFTDLKHDAQLDSDSLTITTKRDSVFTTSEGTKVIVIDEATFLSERELQILSKWAEVNNVHIIAMGDRKQNGKIEQFDAKQIITGIEDCIYISGPELTESIRVSNIAKANNLRDLTITINRVLDKYREQPWLTPNDINTILQETKKVKTILSYYEFPGKTFVGEKFIEESEINKYADEFLQLSVELRKDNEAADDKKPKVLLITEDSTKYAALESKGITILTPKQAQGGEYDYVIIDKDFSKNSSDWDAIRDFYTCVSRSKHGTVIVGNKAFQTQLNISTQKVDKSNADVPISFVDNSDSLRNWKNEILSEIVSEEIATVEEDSDTNPEDTDEEKEETPLDAPFDDGAKPSILTGESKKDEKEQKEIKEVYERKNPKLKAFVDKKTKGKNVTNRRDFLSFIESFENEFDITTLGLDDTPVNRIRYKNFVRLFSSAVLFNLDIQSHHVDKIVNETGLDRALVQSIATEWNTQKRHFAVDGGVVYYISEYQDVSIPVATVTDDKISGHLILNPGENPFKQVTRPIKVPADTRVGIDKSITYGSMYSGSRILAPTANSPQPGRGVQEKKKNENFVKSNNGKSFTLWSECDLLTDEDFEKMFTYSKTQTDYVSYLNGEMVEETVNNTTQITYNMENGSSQCLLLNVNRTCRLSDLYDIVCIARFAVGRIKYSDLTTSQQNKIGYQNDRVVAMNYMKGILGNFGYNLLDSTDEEVKKSQLAESLSDLKSKYRLLIKGAQSKVLGEFYRAFKGLSNEHPNWYVAFVENVFNVLKHEPVTNRAKDTIYTQCLQINVKLQNGGYANYIAKYRADGFYDIYEFKNFNIGIKVGEVSAKGPDLHFYDIVGIVDPSIKSEDDFEKALTNSQITLSLLKESHKPKITVGRNTWYDSADDYDYIFSLLNDIPGLDLTILEDQLGGKGQFAHGFTINDLGSQYQVGGDRNSNDSSQTAWRVNDAESSIPWSAAIVGIEPSQFELVGDFKEIEEEPEEETEESVSELQPDSTSFISDLRENLVSLQDMGYLEVSDEVIDEIIERHRDTGTNEEVMDMILKELSGLNPGYVLVQNADGNIGYMPKQPSPQGNTEGTRDIYTESIAQSGLNPDNTEITKYVVPGTYKRWILTDGTKWFLCKKENNSDDIDVIDVTDKVAILSKYDFDSKLSNPDGWFDEMDSVADNDDYDQLDALYGLMTGNEKFPKCN